MVSFAADALKRLVICNRIIRPTSGTIDRSISSSSSPRRCRPSPASSDARRPFTVCRDIVPSSLRECPGSRSPLRPFAKRHRHGIISVHGKSDFYLGTWATRPFTPLTSPSSPSSPSSLASVSPRALFIRAHIRTYKIFREFFSGNPRGARPRCDRASIEDEGMKRAVDEGRREDRRKLLLVIRVAANEPCSLHFPIVITLLVISSL